MVFVMANYKSIDDNTLLLMVSKGDKGAEEELVIRYMRLVRMCARPLFLVGGDSEDLIQEGMMGLLSAIRQYDKEQNSSFKSFAILCINRRLYDAIKVAARSRRLPLNEGISLDDILSNESQASVLAFTDMYERSPEDQFLARESKNELLKILAQRLSKLEKKVLDMYLEGLSYNEMATFLGKDIKSVDNAVQRIRSKLARTTNLGDISRS